MATFYFSALGHMNTRNTTAKERMLKKNTTGFIAKEG